MKEGKIVQMKWAFLVPGVAISGGINVIYEHIAYAVEQGVEVTMLCNRKLSNQEASWHRAADSARYMLYEECTDEMFDVAVATEWSTVYDVFKVNAKKYVYFVQAIESQFFKDENSFQARLAELTYTFPFQYITEASWIKKYLENLYGWEAQLVLNGIDKEIFHAEVMPVNARPKGKLRVLVEGNVGEWRKNVAETIKLCKQSEADEVWLMTSSDKECFKGVDKFFSKVPMQDVPQIYASCDVLVKLSLVEGMFGPPLEMFHCGGTAIVYDIDGSEEYIADGYNALVVPKHATSQVVECINKLKKNPDMLHQLKENAYKTAEQWRGWDIASKEFYETVLRMPDTETRDKENLMRETKAYGDWRHICNMLEGCKISESKLDGVIETANQNRLKIVLYGAGNFAKGILLQLSERNVPISGIAVTKAKNNPTVFFGHEVLEITEYVKGKKDYLIVIATSKYQEEITETLQEMGFEYIFCI